MTAPSKNGISSHTDPLDDVGGDGKESTVKLDTCIYNQLKVIIKKKDGIPQPTLKEIIHKLVRQYISREEFLEKYRPFIYIISMHESSIFIKDERQGKIVEVMLRYENEKQDTVSIYCDSCKTDFCVHTAFTISLPELGELKIKNHPC